MELAEAFVTIRAKVDKAGFQREIEQGVGSAGTAAGATAGKNLSASLTTEAGKGGKAAGDAAGKNLEESLQTSARRTASNLGGILGALGAGLFLKGAFSVEEDALQSQAKLTLQLKNNGEQAGVTAEGLDRLTKSIAQNGAVTDESVKNAAALLLTFADVRNEAGKGNEIFNRSLQLSTDLSAFWGRDLSSSATQLGRALENPTAGISALTRSGIAFSAQVRQQITDLAKQGDLVGAQRLILDQVQQKVGGAAEAIAKADPFKRFSTSLTEFKEQVGADLLPAVTSAVDVAKQMLAVFGAIPAPIRAAGEGLIGLGVAGIGISRVIGVLDGLKVSLFGVTAAEEGATAASFGLGAGFASVFAGLGLGILAANKINDVLGGTKPNVDALAKSFDGLATSHGLDKNASDELGSHLTKLAGDLKTIQGSTFEKGFGLAPSAHQAVKDIDSVNAALEQLLADKGIAPAFAAFEQLRDTLLADGASIDSVNKAFDPFLLKVGQAGDASKTSASGIADLTTQIDQLNQSLFTPNAERFGVQDAINNAFDAQKALNDARLDAIGQGPKSQAASDAVKTAMQSETAAVQSLADAQQSAKDSSRTLADAQNSLADAQKKLAEFDNPTSQTIRTLERVNIVRRVVSTPEQVNQKEIDLLKFDQDNTDKRAGLVDSVAKANEGVSKALEGVSKAEENVQKAAQKVQDAQGKVADAAKKRRDVQVAAAADVSRAELKAEEAVNAVGTALASAKDIGDKAMLGFLNQLDLISKSLDPTSDLSKRLDALILKQQALSQGSAGVGQNPNAQGGFGHGRPASGAGGPNTPAANNALGIYNTFNPALRAQIESGTAPLTKSDVVDIIQNHVTRTDPRLDPAQVDFLHRLGVPGFRLGGIVPGALGEARLVVAHGGERVQTAAQQSPEKTVHVTQENHYHGADKPTTADAEWNSRLLGWMITRLGDEA